MFDDHPAILKLPPLQMTSLDFRSFIDALFVSGDRYPERGIPRLSFALNFYLAGGAFDQYWFKFTNVAIHVFNGVVLFFITRMLVPRIGGLESISPKGRQAVIAYAPALVAALWLINPIQLTAVLYVVQRMTSLSATFVFLGIAIFVAGRIKLEQCQGGESPWPAILLAAFGIAGMGTLGFLCKENAVLLPFLAVLVELFFFTRATLSVRARRLLYGFFGVFAIMPAIVGTVGLVIGWDTIVGESYRHRDYDMVERLLTQPRMLWSYVLWMVVPHLRWYGLYHDDIAISHGLFDPITTAPAVLAWVLLLAWSIWSVRKRSLLGFAVLWFLLAHVIESSFIGLEMVFEHRNYVPSYALFLAMGCVHAACRAPIAGPGIAPLGVGVRSLRTFSIYHSNSCGHLGFTSNNYLLRDAKSSNFGAIRD